jgi:hypothetical protein
MIPIENQITSLKKMLIYETTEYNRIVLKQIIAEKERLLSENCIGKGFHVAFIFDAEKHKEKIKQIQKL